MSASRVEASAGMEGSVVVSVPGETIRDGKNSNLCNCQTQEDTHMREVRGRRASIRLING